MKVNILGMSLIVIILCCMAFYMGYGKGNIMSEKNPPLAEGHREIWLAGGCFWGVEAYLEKLTGVVFTNVGYANGKTENPTYKEVVYQNTGHAETVYVQYDPQAITLTTLLTYYLKIIDPTSLNRQGPDIGTQYRTGIYFLDPADKITIDEVLLREQQNHQIPIAVEVVPLVNYYVAEEYHQKYLQKNPGGYCHIDLSILDKDPIKKQYTKPSQQELKKKLTDLQFKVTQNCGTEPPFQNEFWNNHAHGLYVDIVTGEPLFSSRDKFDSGTGWPSFTKPVSSEFITTKTDKSNFMVRIEVKSRGGDSHLGHVFPDGPIDTGGQRYCINSSALRFIPYEEMEQEGYGVYKPFVK